MYGGAVFRGIHGGAGERVSQHSSWHLVAWLCLPNNRLTHVLSTENGRSQHFVNYGQFC